MFLHSYLFAYVIEKFCWGYYSPAEIQRLSSALLLKDLKAATAAGPDATFPDVEASSGIGNSGRQPSNMHRDLMTTLRPIPLAIASAITLPIKLGGQLTKAIQSMILPHKLFAPLYHNYKNAFYERIATTLATISSFWESVKDSPQFQEHPGRHRANFRRKAISLFVHGDGVPCTGIGKAWTKMFDL